VNHPVIHPDEPTLTPTVWCRWTRSNTRNGTLSTSLRNWSCWWPGAGGAVLGRLIRLDQFSTARLPRLGVLLTRVRKPRARGV